MAVELSADDWTQLAGWASAPGTPQQVALRCRLVLAVGKGQADQDIAMDEAVNRHTVRLWRRRVCTGGIGAVWEIGAGRGRKPHYDLATRDALIEATLHSRPAGQTHWSCRVTWRPPTG